MAEFDEEFDLVIVGSGGGSMCAALQHHRNRDRRVGNAPAPSDRQPPLCRNEKGPRMRPFYE